jgi:protein TonB
MRRIDIILGLAVSIGFHGSLWLSSKIGSWTSSTEVVAKAADKPIDVDFTPPEEPPEPPKVTTGDSDAKDTSASDAADAADASAASLPEPMNTIGVSDIAAVIQPSPPVAPKADSVTFKAPKTTGRAIDDSKIPNFVDFNKLDKKPQPRSQAEPVYPYDMKRQGVTGEVTVEFVCDDRGVVQQPFAYSSSRSEFAQPAVDAVAKWRFSPGMKNGRPAATRFRVTVSFTLR